MCGICGQIDPAGINKPSLMNMLTAIEHRGPDDHGIFLDGRIGLGNRRLSIIDVAGGKQPIPNEDETIWIVFNGEIYNYPQLRDELIAAGHHFRTNSDTEVIVHLYEAYGERCVEKLRGMFAFAIWDSRNEKLFIARDHLGQKPLFYATSGDRFLFASEMKGVLASGYITAEMNPEAFHHYLTLRFVPPPQTMLKGVYKLPPAHTLVWRNGRIRLRRYWQLSFAHKTNLPADQLLPALREKLIETVSGHMLSDVPVGAFLSGGMDSSMIVAMMAQDLKLDFRTFAVGVTEQDFSELPYAKMVADHHGTEHIERCVDANLIAMLPHMIWHLDEPSDPIAACQFNAAALAAEHVKVVLGGDGGDELFAGFDRYLGVGYVKYYSWLPSGIRLKLIGPILDRLSEDASYKSLTQQVRWLHQLAQQPDLASRYAEATSFFRFSHQDKMRLYSDAFWQQWQGIRSEQVISGQFDEAPATSPIERMLYADYQTRLPEHSLMLTDRLTMAHGLELRSPFLDHELVEMLASFPVDFKIRDRTLKHGLRELGRSYLPKPIIKRDKQGFMFPVAYWFRGPLYPMLKSWLLSGFFVKQNVIRKDAIVTLLDAHHEQRADHHVRLWMLLNAEIWHQIYIQGRDLESLSQALQASVAGEGHAGT